MIAPLETPSARSTRRSPALAAARRLAAEILLPPGAAHPAQEARLRGLATLITLGWILGFTILYFTFYSWWKIDRY